MRRTRIAVAAVAALGHGADDNRRYGGRGTVEVVAAAMVVVCDICGGGGVHILLAPAPIMLVAPAEAIGAVWA